MFGSVLFTACVRECLFTVYISVRYFSLSVCLFTALVCEYLLLLVKTMIMFAYSSFVYTPYLSMRTVCLLVIDSHG